MAIKMLILSLNESRFRAVRTRINRDYGGLGSFYCPALIPLSYGRSCGHILDMAYSCRHIPKFIVYLAERVD